MEDGYTSDDARKVELLLNNCGSVVCQLGVPEYVIVERASGHRKTTSVQRTAGVSYSSSDPTRWNQFLSSSLHLLCVQIGECFADQHLAALCEDLSGNAFTMFCLVLMHFPRSSWALPASWHSKSRHEKMRPTTTVQHSSPPRKPLKFEERDSMVMPRPVKRMEAILPQFVPEIFQ